MKLLGRLGCTVALRGDGQQALDYLAASPAVCPRPDIILMDTQMPVMGGYEAAQAIRTQPPFIHDPKICATPIISLSPSSMRPQFGYLRGMDDYLAKPLRVSHLKRKLEYWSQRVVLPREPGRMMVRTAFSGQWGMQPFQAYRGPRSRL